MRLSMEYDPGGVRARSEERALGQTPFSQEFFSRAKEIAYRPIRRRWLLLQRLVTT